MLADRAGAGQTRGCGCSEPGRAKISTEASGAVALGRGGDVAEPTALRVAGDQYEAAAPVEDGTDMTRARSGDAIAKAPAWTGDRLAG
jgi:hypothetical protein